jgi:hypothetical protein
MRFPNVLSSSVAPPWRLLEELCGLRSAPRENRFANAVTLEWVGVRVMCAHTRYYISLSWGLYSAPKRCTPRVYGVWSKTRQLGCWKIPSRFLVHPLRDCDCRGGLSPILGLPK